MDLRERVLDAVSAGSSARGAAARFGIEVATAVRWMSRWRETGERGARRQGYPKRSILDPPEAYLLGLIEEEVDITLDEMRARPRDERRVEAARVMIWRSFDRRGITLKKRWAMRRSGTGRMFSPLASPGSRASPISTPNG
ncbi:MAG: IS630 transposase-related protein [Pseudomonadota bacterium]